MRALLPSAALAIALAAAPAAASHCPQSYPEYGPLATGVWQVTGGSAATTYYLDDRDLALGSGVWLYMESNGIWTEKPAGVHHAHRVWEQHDLQVGGCSALIPDSCEVYAPCPPSLPGDTLLL